MTPPIPQPHPRNIRRTSIDGKPHWLWVLALLLLLLLSPACRSGPKPAAASTWQRSAHRAQSTAQSLEAVGQDAAAAARWQEAAGAFALLDQSGNQANALHRLAQCLRRLGQPDAAFDALHQALALNQRLGLKDAWWRNQTALLQLELETGRESAASARIDTVRSGEGSMANPDTRAAWANEVGQWEVRRGQLDAALAQYSVAAEIYARTKPLNRIGHATALCNQARTLEKLGRPQEALALWRIALEGFKAAGHPPGIATAMAGLGRTMLVLRQQPEEAQHLLHQAAANFERLGDLPSAERVKSLLPRP